MALLEEYMHIRVYLCVYLRMYVRVCVRTYVCVCVCVFVCIYIYTVVDTALLEEALNAEFDTQVAQTYQHVVCLRLAQRLAHLYFFSFFKNVLLYGYVCVWVLLWFEYVCVCMYV